jgi:hypothetical protein
VFGPASRQRAKLRALVPARDGELYGATTPRGSKRGNRVPWTERLRRVFATDVLACPCSGGRHGLPSAWTPPRRARRSWSRKLPCTLATLRAGAGPAAGRALVRRRFGAETGRNGLVPSLDNIVIDGPSWHDVLAIASHRLVRDSEITRPHVFCGSCGNPDASL